jgi:hypothetical protein
MLRVIRRIRVTKGTFVPALAAVLASSAAIASCITGPPSEPPQPPVLLPQIIQNAVMPPANQFVTELPDAFVVPVRVFNPNIPIACSVFVDFDPGMFNAVAPVASCGPMFPALAVEAGVTNLQFTLTPEMLAGGHTSVLDPNTCHTIQCFVAESFSSVSPHTPFTVLGADSVTWQYAPNGPGACTTQFDAGDGAFPDSPSDNGVPLDAVNTPL